MNTPYVLDFSRDGVRLLTGSGTEAEPIGEVGLDDPQFGARLDDLRRRADGHADGLVPATLLMPSEELLVTALDAVEGETTVQRAHRVRRALQGLSPAAGADLASDWALGRDGKLHVAAIRSATLREAERFARAHGFDPVRLSAHAPSKGFPGQPDFGAPGRAAPDEEAPPAPAAASGPDSRPDPRAVGGARLGPALRIGPAAAAPAGGPVPTGTPIRPSRDEIEADGLPDLSDDPEPARSALAPAILGVAVAMVVATGVWAAYFLGFGTTEPDRIASLADRQPQAEEAATAEPLAPTAPDAPVEATAAPPDFGPSPGTTGTAPGGSPPRAADLPNPALDTAPAADSPVGPDAAPAPEADVAMSDPEIVLPVSLLSPPGAVAGDPGDTVPAERAESPAAPRVTQGRPAVVPPPAPNRPTAAPAIPETPGIGVTAGPPPRIPPARPRTGAAADITPDRTQSLAEATARALSGTADLAGADIAAGRVPPRPRPPRATAPPSEGAAATDAVVADVVAALSARDVTAPVPGDEATPSAGAEAAFAIARSLRPDSRPGGLSASAGGEADAPVRVARAEPPAAPPAPPSSSASASGTSGQGKLQLNQINLIGVYGTQSNRRALVRLANGRFVKVKIGDRIDGGQIGAIGSDELHYTKRGQTVRLSMPRG